MAKVELHAIVDSGLVSVEDMLNDVVQYSYHMHDLNQAQKEVKQFDSPDSLKIIKITIDDVPFDWRAEREADKVDEAMDRLKEMDVVIDSAIKDVK